jgi:ComF family protein
LHPNAHCHQCEHHPLSALNSIRSAAFFESGHLREVVHKFKYDNLFILGKSLASLLATCYTINQMKADIIVPVPLHKSRMKERGYNQSAVLAKELARLLHLPVDEKTLIRHRKTQSQMSLNAIDRQKNVANAFSCQRNSLTTKNVLLIDDVCTTGATLDACAATLKTHGAMTVNALTIARAN